MVYLISEIVSKLLELRGKWIYNKEYCNMNLKQERWVSGLNHRFAKPAKEVIPSEGSNPSLSAI